jgi:hypothetical protein
LNNYEKKKLGTVTLIITLICFIGILNTVNIQEQACFLSSNNSNSILNTSALEMDISLSNADVSFIGNDGDQSGCSVAGAGDVNGDGFDDILIGAWGHNSYTGKVYLIFGNASGFSMDTDLSNADASFIGEDSGNRAGCSVAGVGDVNNDTYDDILIGANYRDSQKGEVYLILGKESGWTLDTSLSTANASFIGEANGDQLGQSVAGVGDVNNDGYTDFLIGAEGYSSYTGRVYLFYGNETLGWSMDEVVSIANATFTGEASSNFAGCSVAGAGKVNSDNYDDFLIGAYGNGDGGNEAGKTYLFYGDGTPYSGNINLSNANASYIGEESNDQAGKSIAGVGNVDGDDYDDFIIGAPGNSSKPGTAYLILGDGYYFFGDNDLSTAADASFIGESNGDLSSYSVAGAGDVNNDTYDDILIGAFGWDAGESYLILGKALDWSTDVSLSNVDASFIGESSGDYSGYSVAGAGDINNDTYDDILIGAKNNDEGGGSNPGQTYLFLDFNFTTTTSDGSPLPLLFLNPSDEAIPGIPILSFLSISISSIMIAALFLFKRKVRENIYL